MARDKLDRYYTPYWSVLQCVGEILPTIGMGPNCSWKVLEPSAGGGVWVDALREAWPALSITAIDIDPDAGPWANADKSYRGSFLESDLGRFDMVIGNPPYLKAQEFVKEALTVSDRVLFLLRQGFLASAKRAPFFQNFPPTSVHIMPNRPSFTGEGSTDMSEYCFIYWAREAKGHTQLKWLSPVEREKRLCSKG